MQLVNVAECRIAAGSGQNAMGKMSRDHGVGILLRAQLSVMTSQKIDSGSHGTTLSLSSRRTTTGETVFGVGLGKPMSLS
jgi:hypothetical protein